MATVKTRKDADGNKVYDVIFSIRDYQWKRSCPDAVTANVKEKEVEAKIYKVKSGQLSPPIELDKKQLGEWLWSGGIKDVGVSSLPTLDDLITSYLDSLVFTRKSNSTKRIERTKIKTILRHMGKKTLLSTMTEATLQKFVEKRATEKGMKGNDLTGRTIKKELDVLRAIWNKHGLQQRMVDRNWASRFPIEISLPLFSHKAKFKTLDECVDDFESVYLMGDEVNELLAHCKERQKTVADIYKWGYAGIAYCAFTSFRRGTMINQEVSMINWKLSRLTGWVGKEKKGFKPIPREVPMMPNLPEILREWLDNGHPGGNLLFCCKPDKLILDIQAWRCWNAYVKGTKFEAIEGQYHLLRHSFISIAIDRGYSKDDIRVFTGHHSEAIEQLYTHKKVSRTGERMKGMFS